MKETYVPLLHLFEALAFCFAIKSWPMCSGWSKERPVPVARLCKSKRLRRVTYRKWCEGRALKGEDKGAL